MLSGDEMLKLEKLIASATLSINSLIRFIGDKPDAPNNIGAAVTLYGKLKGELGSETIAEKLKLSLPELQVFERTIRDMSRRLDKFDEKDEYAVRNTIIGILKYFSWAETLTAKGVDLHVFDDIEGSTSEEYGYKQIRAIELIIRALINERFNDQQNLEKELKIIFKPDVIDTWIKSGDKNNLLSGTTFSELSSLFVNKTEFKNYLPLFLDSNHLTFIKDNRKTIFNFLDDVRRIRNILAHNKHISNIQLSLLDLYYDELISPIQEAHDQDETTVDPSVFIDVSKEELDGYFNNLHEDINTIKDELADFRDSVESSLGIIAEDTSHIKKEASIIKSKTNIVLAGISILIIGFASIHYLVNRTSSETSEIKEGVRTMASNIGSMNNNLENLAASGGIVANPKNPADYYHNARLLAQRGEADNALENYKALFQFDMPYADPVLGVIALTRQKYGTDNLAAIIDSIIPLKQETLNRYAKLVLNFEPSSEEMRYWLEKEIFYPPAVAQIVKKAENYKTWNRERYLLQTQLEKKYLKHNRENPNATYYLDKILGESEYTLVKKSDAESEDDDFFNSYLESPVVFSSNVMGNDGQIAPGFRFGIYLQDDLHTSVDKFQIKLAATGDILEHIEKRNEMKDSDRKLILDEWIDYKPLLVPLISIRNDKTFLPLLGYPYDVRNEGDILRSKICASWLYQGAMTVKIKWIDSEGIERISDEISVCPPKLNPALLHLSAINSEATNDKNRSVEFKLTNILPIISGVDFFPEQYYLQKIILKFGNDYEHQVIYSEKDIDLSEFPLLFECMDEVMKRRDCSGSFKLSLPNHITKAKVSFIINELEYSSEPIVIN